MIKYRDRWPEFYKLFTKPGEAHFNRVECAKRMDLSLGVIHQWFHNVGFLDKLEFNLRKASRDKSKIKEALIEASLAIASANIADCFYTDPITQDTFPLPLSEIPKETQMAIQQYKVIRVRVPGEDGKMEYRDVLDIRLLDKTNAMRLIGEWVDMKGSEKKLGEKSKDQILGLNITHGTPKILKEPTNGKRDKPGSGGEVQLLTQTDNSFDEPWISE